MTDTFDWAGLWQGAEAAKHDCMFCDCDAPNEAAAAYLRTRIEAAFVPRADHMEDMRAMVARAEAAEARVAELTAHTRALIEGAGELVPQVMAMIPTAYADIKAEISDAVVCYGAADGCVREGGCEEACLMLATYRKGAEFAATQAAATIAALKAQIERLTEREAQAKLDGVRAGIEASAAEARDCALFDSNDQMINCDVRATCAQVIRALDAEAIAKDDARAAALSDLIAECAVLLDGGK